MDAQERSKGHGIQRAHCLICYTCGNETTMAVGEMNPWVEAKFREFHPPPHHDVRDEDVTWGRAP